MSDLSIWTVYDHPRDFPHCVVARRFAVDMRGSRPTGDLLVGPSLNAVRSQLQVMFPDLIRLERSPGDDPLIVEVWL